MEFVLKATLQADYLTPYYDFWIVTCGAKDGCGKDALPVVHDEQVIIQAHPVHRYSDTMILQTGSVEVEVVVASLTHFLVDFPEAFLFHQPERVWVPKSKFLALPVEKSLQVA